MWEEELHRIASEKAKYDEKVNMGASDIEIGLFKAKVLAELKNEVPEDYIGFLEVVNGIEFNGFIIYGVDSELLETKPNQHINGFIDNNLVFYDNEWQKRYLFFGESSISWYVYDLERARYLQLDNPSESVVKEFICFNDMIERIILDSLK